MTTPPPDQKDSPARELRLPQGVTATIEAQEVTVKGSKGELSRTFVAPNITIRIEKDSIIVKGNTKRRKTRALAGTVFGHISNMVRGVSREDPINYKLKIVYSHFPMNIKVQGNQVAINNFLGEKHPRSSQILPSVKVDIKGQDVIVTGIGIEAVAQTAANLEQATKIRNRDPRVFQDGIYLIEKDGKPVH